jgi:predicted nucleic acid-binding protein
MSRPVVSNASPLIALKQIGQMELLSHLFNPVLVAPAVVREVEPTLPRLPEWVEVSALKQPLGAYVTNDRPAAMTRYRPVGAGLARWCFV